MISNNTIPIFFAADVNYYQHLCVLIVSILERNQNERFLFNVMTDREDDEAEKIKSLADKYPNFDIRFMVMNDSMFEGLPLPLEHITLQMYYRLLIPLLVPELEKALYLDSDMVCNIGLRELWTTPIDGYYVAGVPDNLGWDTRRYLCQSVFPQRTEYINSGMLLMNLSMIRNENKIPELFAWLQSHPETKYPDQDAVNSVFLQKIKIIDTKWNNTTGCQRKLRKSIAHFITEKKPWRADRYCPHHCASLYFRYLKLTPYRNYIIKWRKESWKIRMAGRVKECIKFPERFVRNYIVKPLKKTA
ncbi:MAG: glycosyltransferase family 8 protein [Planctomycetaceae bacterium]|jgi:lipopolysaccharide biosynthesis glycosyltransferase|nr:glycosyltransferase family 8 protein [Planctomycetaceae bacterium]